MNYLLLLLLVAVPDVSTSSEEYDDVDPGDIEPRLYWLHMHIDPNSDEFWGVVKVSVVCKKRTLGIVINADTNMGLTIEKKEIRVYSDKGEYLRKQAFQDDLEKKGTLTVIMIDPLEKNKTYLLEIPFSGTMSEQLTGLIRLKDGEGYSVVLNLKRTTASQVFPYIGEIHKKASFILIISYTIDPKVDTQVFSNSSRENRIKTEEEDGEVLFMKTDKIFIYQLSFLLTRSGKKLLASTEDPVNVNFWCNENSKPASQFMENIIDPSKSVLKRSLGGGNYKTNKIDYVLLQVEMEINIDTPGLIIKRGKDYQNEASISEENAQIFLTESMEKTNLWWEYNTKVLVGTMATGLFGQILVLSADITSKFILTDLRKDLVPQMLSVMRSDSVVGSKDLLDHSIFADVEDSPTKLGKGLFIFFMMDYLISSEKMKKGITEFVARNKNKDVNVLNFLEVVLKDYSKSERTPGGGSTLGSRVLSIVTLKSIWKKSNSKFGKRKLKFNGNSVQTIIKGWIFQGGYPVIHVERTASTVKVTQSRFYSDRVRPATKECWWIPLIWTTNADDSSLENLNEVKPMAWLGCKTKYSSQVEVPSINPDHWILFNRKIPYLYRVDYDRGSWLKIKEILNERSKYSKIPVENRALLINDALVLSYSGGYGIDLETAFQLVSNLRHDTATGNDVVWLSFFDGMDRFKRTIEKKDIYKTNYKDFMQFILKNIYKEIFPSANKVKSYIETDVYDPSYEMKSLIYKESCSSGVPDCLQHSTEIYEEWKSGQLKITEFPKRLSRDIFTSVLCSEIQKNPAEVDYIVQKFNSADTSNIHREILLDGISCLKDVDKMTWAFDWCLNTAEETIVAMKSNLIVKFLKGPYTYVEASNYFFNNYEKIGEYFRKWAEKKIPSAMPSFVKIITCETDIYVVIRLKQLYINVPKLRTITEEERVACDQRYNDDYVWLVQNKVNLEKALQSASTLK